MAVANEAAKANNTAISSKADEGGAVAYKAHNAGDEVAAHETEGSDATTMNDVGDMANEANDVRDGAIANKGDCLVFVKEANGAKGGLMANKANGAVSIGDADPMRLMSPQPKPLPMGPNVKLHVERPTSTKAETWLTRPTWSHELQG